jgi:hypothetical protein
VPSAPAVNLETATAFTLGAEQALAAGLALGALIAPSVSNRRAMVERKGFSPFTSVATGRKIGGCFWAA